LEGWESLFSSPNPPHSIFGWLRVFFWECVDFDALWYETCLSMIIHVLKWNLIHKNGCFVGCCSLIEVWINWWKMMQKWL
jgi:hypothetical protein